MEIDTVANVIVELFAAQAILGLTLFAIVIGAIVRAFIREHHRDEQRSHGRHPR